MASFINPPNQTDPPAAANPLPIRRNRPNRLPSLLPETFFTPKHQQQQQQHHQHPAPPTDDDLFSYTAQPDPNAESRLEVLGIEFPEYIPLLPPRTATSHKRSLKELGPAYGPLRLEFYGVDEKEDNSYPGKGRGAEWFQLLTSDVWFLVRRFAAEYFGYEDLGDGDDAWASVAGERELVMYVDKVARGWGTDGGWADVMGKRVQREAVVTGVIAKVLQDGVWDRLMFGAGKEVERHLNRQDKLEVKGEGKSFFS